LVTDSVDRAGPRRVEERSRIADLNLRRYWRKAETHRDADRSLRANFNQAGPRRKTLGVYAETINTESKVLYQVAPIYTQLKGSAKLIGFADEFGMTRDRSPLWITHLDTQFTASALRVGSPSAKKD